MGHDPEDEYRCGEKLQQRLIEAFGLIERGGVRESAITTSRASGSSFT